MYNKDLKADRILLVIGIILYSAWGLIYKIYLPGAIDPLYIRIIGVFIMLITLLLSFSSHYIQEHFTCFLYGLIYFVTFHQSYLTAVNNFSSEFLLLFVVVIVILNAYFKKITHLLFYVFFSIVFICAAYFIPITNPTISFGFFIGSIITIEALIIPIFISRIRVTEKLAGKVEEIEKSKNELQKKSDELIRSNNDLQQFAYIASHDLQEPLRMVTSYVQLLAERYKDKLDAEAGEFIKFAVDGAQRMRNLIQSLLEYSRLNKIRPFEKINPNALLENVLSEMAGSINESGAIIKIDELSSINGDPVLITQLFRNLISNAIKFRDNSRKSEVFISGKKTDEGFLFSVKDNGIGIAKEYYEKIFVMFQRFYPRDKYPGSGMGLAICKKIVEQHGGKIWVESEINKGSTFYFTIK